MRIVYVASEIAPFAKTGGLADVGAGLPVALARRGHDVRVVIPKYRGVAETGVSMKGPAGRIDVQVDGVSVDAEVYQGVYPSTEGTGAEVQVDFIDCPAYFDRASLYGEDGKDYSDNLERFVFFCRGVLGWLDDPARRPDIIHANDWHTSLIPTYIKSELTPGLKNTGVLYTIHNLAYQGIFPKAKYSVLGLPWDLFHLDALEFFDQINLSKGGIIFSDAVSTVSPQYSREIQTEGFGCGLDGLLTSAADRVHGILNGCDTTVWDPATDENIAKKFSLETLEGGKAANKRALRDAMGLDNPKMDPPLFAVVSRLVTMKGMDLLIEIADRLVADGAQLAVLGSGDAGIETALRECVDRHPGAIALRVGYDEPLSHLFFAGCDFFLMPSRFEPCGLTQMYAMQYGALPVVHAVGGLADTVQDIGGEGITGNGFRFDKPSRNEFLQACRRAIAVYDDPPRRLELAKHAMTFDTSWDRAAADYEELFRKIVESKTG